MSDIRKRRSVSDVRKCAEKDTRDAQRAGDTRDRSRHNLEHLEDLTADLRASLPGDAAQRLEASIRKAYDQGRRDYEQASNEHERRVRNLERERRDVSDAVRASVKDGRTLRVAERDARGSSLEATVGASADDMDQLARQLRGVEHELEGAVSGEISRRDYDVPGGEKYMQEHLRRLTSDQQRADEDARYHYERAKRDRERRAQEQDRDYRQQRERLKREYGDDDGGS